MLSQLPHTKSQASSATYLHDIMSVELFALASTKNISSIRKIAAKKASENIALDFLCNDYHCLLIEKEKIIFDPKFFQIISMPSCDHKCCKECASKHFTIVIKDRTISEAR